jgi:hypothetical protein
MPFKQSGQSAAIPPVENFWMPDRGLLPLFLVLTFGFAVHFTYHTWLAVENSLCSEKKN